jgi:hypothetical protein
MQRKILFIVLVISTIAFSCSAYDQQSRKVRRATKRFESRHILLLGCAYQATKGTCIYFWKNHRFSIESSDGLYYAGKYSIKGDTVSVTFYKDIRPINKRDYLLIDPTNKYVLIYPSITENDWQKFDLKKPSSIL